MKQLQEIKKAGMLEALKMSDKKLYCTYINKQLFYAYARNTKKHTAIENALILLRNQSLKLNGRFNITELSVREGDKGAYKWNKIQLTRELLQHCCGQSS